MRRPSSPNGPPDRAGQADGESLRGARIYNRAILAIYDQLVIRWSNSLAWRCPRQVMLTQYDQLMGHRHLDVGPGTGWYLVRGRPAGPVEITLLDLNTQSLSTAAARLGHTQPATLLGDVLRPLPPTGGLFDSIAANYLLHCLPGSWQDKEAAIRHLADRLADDGVLFGGTILGRGVQHNRAGRGLMKLYNQLGIFHNTADDESGLRAVLERHFGTVSVEIVGVVAIFRARRPRRGA